MSKIRDYLLDEIEIGLKDEDNPNEPVAKVWEIALASVIGGLFLTIADLVFNKSNAVTSKMGETLQSSLFQFLPNHLLELFAFLLMILMGLGLCFVHRPRRRVGAFARGSSVILVLTTMNIAVNNATAQSMAQSIDGNIEVTLQQPESYGPLGLGTFLNGDSNANLLELQVENLTLVNCDQVVSIGQENFCEIDLQMFEEQVRLEPNAQMIFDPQLAAQAQRQNTNGKIWIRQPAAGG
ncbi:MAG: hypothetical protein AAF429_13270 [Pseudomonadota bacterium]